MSDKTGIILFMLLNFSAAVYAKSEVDVVTTVSVAVINADLNISEVIKHSGGTATRIKTSKPEIQGAEVGVTLIDDKYYYGFNTQITGQSVSKFNDIQDGTSNISSDLNTRSSFNVFAGYSAFENGSLYLGLTKGTSSYGDKVSTKEVGPFIGGRYAFRPGASSSLTFDMAYSKLGTSFELKDDTYKNPGNPDGHNISTDATGFSYSLTWLKSLDRGRSFFVRLKQVNLGIKSGSTNVTNGVATISGHQNMTSLNFGMAF